MMADGFSWLMQAGKARRLASQAALALRTIESAVLPEHVDEHAAAPAQAIAKHLVILQENATLFFECCFPHLCLSRACLKCLFLQMNGSKRPFSHLRLSVILWNIRQEKDGRVEPMELQRRLRIQQPAASGRYCPCKKTHVTSHFLSAVFHLCLSRACLGKTITILSIKRHHRER
jgi:hypothetical protein